jgi:[acyl-carrier-protein] S-malonyltransferase
MGYALVFSGQGTQHAAMLPWLEDDDMVRSLCERLGVSAWRRAAADDAWLQRNAVAQPLLTGLALAAWQQLAARLPPPAAVAGYSVGELAAFSAAGVFDAQTALELACRRAAAMDAAAAARPGRLMAVSHAGPHEIDAACADTGVSVAIRNGPAAVVLGGDVAALARAEHLLAAQGARCTHLRVGVASHTPSMQAAAAAFDGVLAAHTLAAPRWPLFSNAADRVRSAGDARHALTAQIASTVRWDECMDNLHARGVDCVLELGPGAALARLWNERYPGTPARCCDEFRSVQGIQAWLLAHLAG